MVAVAGVVAIGLAASGRSAPSLSVSHHASSGAGRSGLAPASPGHLSDALSFNPPGGATGVAPNMPVTVHTARGRLTSVTLTTGSGPPLAGSVSPDGTTWQVGQGLAGSSAYQVAVEVATASTKATATETFQTLTPKARVIAEISPSDGSTVGVGAPIAVKFDESVPVANQAGVLSHLSVAESRPVPAGWHWFSSRELHLRPQAFWPTGEQITVTSNLDGWDAGGGAWGSGQAVTHVRIGDSHVAVANLSTEEMSVSANGQVVATYPLSAGSTRYPTQDGIHIAIDKEPVVHMVSSTVGIPSTGPGGYDEYVYNDVHISDSGEYVHAAPWSVGSQGRSNVSHGCINLSTSNSKTFYDFSSVGDVIEVIGGSRNPVAGDHGVMDWTLDWSQWTPAVITQA